MKSWVYDFTFFIVFSVFTEWFFILSIQPMPWLFRLAVIMLLLSSVKMMAKTAQMSLASEKDGF